MDAFTEAEALVDEFGPRPPGSDAERRAAQHLAKRLEGIGRDAHLEALEFAEGINQGRNQQNYGTYGAFGDEARGFYDAQFNPSQYEQLGRENLGKQMEFDMSKLDLGMGGAAKAGGVVNNAALGQQAAYTGTNKLATSSPFAKLMEGGNNLIDSYAKKFATMGAG